MAPSQSRQNSKEVNLRRHQGLDDPLMLPNGAEVWFDKQEGKYYDPKTDIYLSNEELMDMMR